MKCINVKIYNCQNTKYFTQFVSIFSSVIFSINENSIRLYSKSQTNILLRLPISKNTQVTINKSCAYILKHLIYCKIQITQSTIAKNRL